MHIHYKEVLEKMLNLVRTKSSIFKIAKLHKYSQHSVTCDLVSGDNYYVHCVALTILCTMFIRYIAACMTTLEVCCWCSTSALSHAMTSWPCFFSCVAEDMVPMPCTVHHVCHGMLELRLVHTLDIGRPTNMWYRKE